MGGFLTALIIGALLQIGLGWAMGGWTGTPNVQAVYDLVVQLGDYSREISIGAVALLTGLIFSVGARPGVVMGLIFGAIVGVLTGVAGFLGTDFILGNALPTDWQAYFMGLVPMTVGAIAGGGAIGGLLGGLLGGRD